MSKRKYEFMLESDEQNKFINRNFHELIALLIDSRGDINERNRAGQSPLILGILDGTLRIVKTLIDKGADINLADDEGYTPLMYSILEGREAIALYLIKRGARVCSINEEGVDALALAKEAGLFKLAHLIEKVIKKLSTNAEQNSSYWPLYNSK